MSKNYKLTHSFGVNDVEIVSQQTVYQGFFKIEQLRYRYSQFEGGSSEYVTRELFERGNAVAVLPYDPVRDEVVLLEQCRTGMIKDQTSPWSFEIVAGMCEPDESDLELARREAKEEAGLDLQDINFISKFYLSPGGSSEMLTLYWAPVNSLGVGGTYGCPDENEDIRVFTMSRQDALQVIEDGSIRNVSAIIALQWLQLHYQELSV